MLVLGDLHHQNDDFGFSDAEKWKFRRKIVLETDFGANWTILKKSIFLAPKPSGGVGFFSTDFVKNDTMSDLEILHHQNGDFGFSSCEKWKFRKKMSLELDFGSNRTILKNWYCCPKKWKFRQKISQFYTHLYTSGRFSP